jgi:hypothetical protein
MLAISDLAISTPADPKEAGPGQPHARLRQETEPEKTVKDRPDPARADQAGT